MPFPNLKPTSRTFDAGNYPIKTFQSQSGIETRILYGSRRTGMTLQLSFDNITDANAESFVTHFDETKGTYGTFALSELARSGWSGSTSGLNVSAGNQWRYDSAPSIVSVRPGISNVTVSLKGVL